MNNKRAKELRKFLKLIYFKEWRRHYKDAKKAYAEIMKEK